MTVWSPALTVGRLFVEMAELLSQYAERGNGLSRQADDFCVIEVDVLRAFIMGLLTAAGAQHPVRAQLVRGFVATSLVLLERSGVSPSNVTTDRGLCAEAEFLARSMPVL